MSSCTQTQKRLPSRSRDVILAYVQNGVPSFFLFHHSPAHDPFSFNWSMTRATIRAFSSGG